MNTLLHWQFGKKKPLPQNTEIGVDLHHDSSPVVACALAGTGLSTYYLNNNLMSFVNATVLYRDWSRKIFADYGYYSDGRIVRLWNGSSFISTEFCTNGDVGGGGSGGGGGSKENPIEVIIPT